jgi:hypothetical protein
MFTIYFDKEEVDVSPNVIILKSINRLVCVIETQYVFIR